MSEYYYTVTGSQVGTQTYNKVALIDTTNTSVSLAKVSQLIANDNANDPVGYSSIVPPPLTYNKYTFSVTTTTAHTVTTT